MAIEIDELPTDASPVVVEARTILRWAQLAGATPQELLDVDLDEQQATPVQLVDIMSAAQTLIGQLQAIQLAATDRLRRARGSERDTADEVALAQGISRHAADRQVALADQLGRFPATRAALHRGDIDQYKASRVVESALLLDDDKARQLDDDIAPLLPHRNATAIQRSVRYRVAKLDPDGAAARAQQHRRHRRIEFLGGYDGMADLAAYLPATDAQAIYGRIDTIASTIRSTDDPRSMDEIRADVFTELLLGHNHSHVTYDVAVTVPVSTLAGVSQHPAELPGYGPLPATIARDIARHPRSTWRRLLTDPADGQLLAIGRRRYRPPAALDDYVRRRDQHCRMPGCHRPARHCDVDHHQPWSAGGTTDAGQLLTLCRRHHRLKDTPGWHYDLHPDGKFVVHTPTGRRHHSTVPAAAPP